MDEKTKKPGAVIHQDVMMPMRDGIRLAADIYLPAAEGGGPVEESVPALLIRTSWDKSNEEWDDVRAYYPRRGYALVIQDLRSRFKSEGDGRYYHTANPWEGEDGFDTVEWIAAPTVVQRPGRHAWQLPPRHRPDGDGVAPPSKPGRAMGGTSAHEHLRP